MSARRANLPSRRGGSPERSEGKGDVSLGLTLRVRQRSHTRGSI